MLLARYDWLINYFHEPIKKAIDIVKDDLIILFKTDKDYSKKTNGNKSRNQIEDKIVRLTETKINRVRKIISS